ncbi:hypothetical protein AK812_SmicGene33746 [Symbiodinium microadriaticum]|uniref:Uncharacterized protein n=1 Tax=Symbiodinium microadriaticum TaxID=2951 RepID=A0A1Q9CQS4_SYMMI|nr:hypothetical protein AK812_SmicGene33746 [Symbiodinium microadriaticum]
MRTAFLGRDWPEGARVMPVPSMSGIGTCGQDDLYSNLELRGCRLTHAHLRISSRPQDLVTVSRESVDWSSRKRVQDHPCEEPFADSEMQRCCRLAWLVRAQLRASQIED